MKLTNAATNLSLDDPGLNNETNRTGIWDTGEGGNCMPGVLQATSGSNETKSYATTSRTFSTTYATEKNTKDISKAVIAHIIWLCGLPDDSTMVKYFKQKGWSELFHMTSICMDELQGISIDEAQPSRTHIRMLKCFILYYKHKSRDLHFTSLDDDDVTKITKYELYTYCRSDAYIVDLKSWIEVSNASRIAKAGYPSIGSVDDNCPENLAQQVDTLNIRIGDDVKAPESIQLEVVRGIGLSDEGLEKEKVVNIEIDVDARHVDVINDDSFVSQGNSGEDVLMKMDSKYLAQKNLEESTASVDSHRTFIRNSNGEHDPYRKECNISNVSVSEIDTVCHMDDRNVDRKPPDKLRERNRSKQEQEERFIADSYDVHGSTGTGSNGYTEVDVDLTLCEKQTFCDIVLMSWDMHPFRDDDLYDGIDDDVDNNANRSVAAVTNIEADNGENVKNKIQEMIPYHIEWGTCPLCKGCGILGNSCLECIHEGMKFESTPRCIYNTKDGVGHMIDISRRIICEESLVSLIKRHILMSTPETAVENFLHAMTKATSEPDVEHYIDSRLELIKLCGMKTVCDIVARSYRLHQANSFEYMNKRTGEMTIVGVCDTEYELFCEVGAIWLMHQHHMQSLHPMLDITPRQRRMSEHNCSDLGAATIDIDICNDGFSNTSLKKHTWLGDSGASVHVTNDATGMFDCRPIQVYLKISNGKHLFASRIGNKKVSIVQENGSTLDLILHDCMYIPELCINLFSITKALSEGWKISNHGLQIVLSQSDQNIKFDQILKTAHGYVCGVTILPRRAIRFAYMSAGGKAPSVARASCNHTKRQDDIELDSNPSVKRRMVTIDPKDLIGQTFLKDGQRFHVRVVCAVIDKEEDLKKGSGHIKFICEVPNSTVDEIFTYNEILDHIARDNEDIDNDTEKKYKFRRITAHQGPLHSSDKDYKGSAFNVLAEWESGETTYEPLGLIASDDPVTCAEYAKQHNLLDTADWKRF